MSNCLKKAVLPYFSSLWLYTKISLKKHAPDPNFLQQTTEKSINSVLQSTILELYQIIVHFAVT
jgi:hypothetical protein